MRPFLEKPTVPQGQSWALLDRRLPDGIPFQWHHHREFELTLTLNSEGQRFVADHIGRYGDGDLVLLGPNLPHTWASHGQPDPARPHVALVMWFRAEWADGLMAAAPELAILNPMLTRAARGLKFSAGVATSVRPAIERLARSASAQRLTALLDVLVTLAGYRSAVPLASPDAADATLDVAGHPRIERVLDHIHAHYPEPIRVETLAEIAHLSPSGLHRLFRRHMRTTVSAYVAQMRVGWACELLTATSRPVAHVAAEVGLPNLSHFNRQFRALKGMTPRDFRALFRAAGRASPRPYGTARSGL